MKITTALLLILSIAGVAHAETELETCADKNARDIIEVVKKTVGIRTDGQLDAIVRLVKVKCHAGENDQDLQTVKSSVKRIAKELLGDTFLAKISWKEKALQNINEQLK